MLCPNPRRSESRPGITFPCGQCMACRINTKRKKTGRLILESVMHDHITFVTLTYSDDEIPLQFCNGELEGILYPQHLTQWLKRFRTRINRKFRYFAVGEYGTKTWRPHYHALLFGIDTFDTDRLLKETWGMGHVSAAESNVERMAYIASYTTKKMTGKDDLHLEGRTPEFSRQSLKPGIGAPAVDLMAGFYQTKAGAQYLAENGDVAPTFRFNGKTYPFDEYIKRRFRTELGIPLRAQHRNWAGPPFEMTPDYQPAHKVTYEELEGARKAEHKAWHRKHSHGTL